MKTLLLRIPAVATCVAALFSASCMTGPGAYYGDGFMPPPNRYGHPGGEMPPSDAPPEMNPGDRRPRAQAEGRSGTTRYLEDESDTLRPRPKPRPKPKAEPREEIDRPAEPSRTEPQPEPTPPQQSAPEPAPQPAPEPPKPKPAPAPSVELPYGRPVPGKAGIVYSPYYKGGYVDVAGMPPGEKVKCPYTKKIFRVP